MYARSGADPGHDREMLALMTAHAKEMPRPPSAYAPQPIPRALDEAILRALSKHPDDRLQSAAAFAAELEQATRVGSCAGAASRPARAARGTMLVHRGARAARVGKGQTVRMAPGFEATALLWSGGAPAKPNLAKPPLAEPESELDLGDRETIPLAAPDHGRLYALLVVASAVIVFVALSLGLGLGK